MAVVYQVHAPCASLTQWAVEMAQGGTYTLRGVQISIYFIVLCNLLKQLYFITNSHHIFPRGSVVQSWCFQFVQYFLLIIIDYKWAT